MLLVAAALVAGGLVAVALVVAEAAAVALGGGALLAPLVVVALLDELGVEVPSFWMLFCAACWLSLPLDPFEKVMAATIPTNSNRAAATAATRQA